MDEDPIKTLVRQSARERRLGKAAACSHCGEPNLACLNRRRTVEEHHVVGKAHDPNLTAPLCLNCHAKTTDRQLRNGTELSPVESFLERIPAAMRSLLAFVEQAVEAGYWFVEQLEKFVSFLNERMPNWREQWNEYAATPAC